MMEAIPGHARVLVVDDSTPFRDNLTEILIAAGCVPTTAPSCAAALEASGPGFDVALVDLRLPDGEGTTLAARLMERSPEAEVVMLTGFATVESAAVAVRAGACAYLVKPCATPELLLTLEQALRKVHLKQEKRELARRAQVAEKLAAVGTLTAGLSHEIRNPLNAAGLQLSVLERRVGRLPAVQQAPLLEPLGLVRDEIRRLNHTLEDFLSFARPRELVRKTVAVDEMLGAILDLLAGQAATQKIRLERKVEPGLRTEGDANRLRQAVFNLLINALDAARPDGWVRLGAVRLPSREVEVSIEDSGPGVPAELRERIFEPFFTTKASGSGLGLPIVHAIITQHGGTLEVESGTTGGARFVIRLPASH